MQQYKQQRETNRTTDNDDDDDDDDDDDGLSPREGQADWRTLLLSRKEKLQTNVHRLSFESCPVEIPCKNNRYFTGNSRWINRDIDE